MASEVIVMVGFNICSTVILETIRHIIILINQYISIATRYQAATVQCKEI